MITEFKHICETTKEIPYTVTIQHGETVNIVSEFRNEGIPVDLTGYTISALYKIPDNNNWYSANATISENKAIVTFANINDNGSDCYNMWIRLEKDSEVSYPVKYILKMLYSPGFTPNAITPLPPTLNFEEFEIVNAPFYNKSEVDGLLQDVINIGDVNTAIENHNTDETAHADIRNSIPTKTSDITNDSGFITANDVTEYDDTEIKNLIDTKQNKTIVKYSIPTNISKGIYYDYAGVGMYTQCGILVNFRSDWNKLNSIKFSKFNLTGAGWLVGLYIEKARWHGTSIDDEFFGFHPLIIRKSKGFRVNSSQRTYYEQIIPIDSNHCIQVVGADSMTTLSGTLTLNFFNVDFPLEQLVARQAPTQRTPIATATVEFDGTQNVVYTYVNKEIEGFSKIEYKVNSSDSYTEADINKWYSYYMVSDMDDAIATHNEDTLAHNDIRGYMENTTRDVNSVADAVTAVANILNSVSPVTAHNGDSTAHSDIRLDITNLTNTVNSLQTTSDITTEIANHNIDNSAHSSLFGNKATKECIGLTSRNGATTNVSIADEDNRIYCVDIDDETTICLNLPSVDTNRVLSFEVEVINAYNDSFSITAIDSNNSNITINYVDDTVSTTKKKTFYAFRYNPTFIGLQGCLWFEAD